MKPVKFFPAAEQEFIEAVRHYEGKAAGLGSRFEKSVEQGIAHIQKFLQTGFPSHAETRTLTLRTFPYGIIFKEYDVEFRVLAVAHHHRREGYWHDRSSS